MPAQEPVLSSPSSASLDALAEHFFDGSEHRARAPAAPHAPSLLSLGDANTKGSPSVGFDSATLTGAVLPPHAEPPLVIDHDGEGWWRSARVARVVRTCLATLEQHSRRRWRSDSVGARACGVLEPQFSVSQTGSQGALNTSEVKSKSKSNFSWPSLVMHLLHKFKSSP